MLFNELLDTLQNLTGFKISQQMIADVLNVRQGAISNRITRKSHLTLDELKTIERHYGVPLVSGANNTIDLNYYPAVFASCGNGLTVFDETSEKISVTKDLIANYSPSNQYSIISARGSSMAPTLNDLDKLIIQHNLNEQIIDDTVYLFKYNDELFIKRLVKNIDQIVCISDNPRFEDRVITPTGDNFTILGKVVGLFRSKV